VKKGESSRKKMGSDKLRKVEHRKDLLKKKWGENLPNKAYFRRGDKRKAPNKKMGDHLQGRPKERGSLTGRGNLSKRYEALTS